MDGLPRAAKMAEVHEVTSELSDLCFENTADKEDTASNGHNMAQSATNASQDSFGCLPALPSASKNRKITRHMSATLAEKARTFLEPNSQTQTTLTGNQRENERTRTSDVQENIEIFNTLAALAQHEAELSSASKPTSRRQSGNESQGGSRRESGSGVGVGGDTHLQSPRRTPSLKVGTGGQDVNNDANWNRRASARSDAAITGSSVGTLPSIEEGSVRARTRLHEDQIRKKSAPDSTKLDRTVRGDSSVNYGGDGEVGEGGVGGYTCEDAEVCLITMRGTFDPPGLAGVCVARDDSVIPRRRSSNMSDLSTEEGRRQHGCNKAYGRKGSLDKHVRTFHEKVRFRCTTCGAFFCAKCSLQDHIRSIHKKERIPCRYCGYRTFLSRDGELQHSKKCMGDIEFSDPDSELEGVDANENDSPASPMQEDPSSPSDTDEEPGSELAPPTPVA